MALCVILNPDGTLAPTGEPVEACTGYVMHSAAENAVLQSLHELFSWPAPEEITAWVMAAFMFVLAMNACGYITGAVVKMVSTERD